MSAPHEAQEAQELLQPPPSPSPQHQDSNGGELMGQGEGNEGGTFITVAEADPLADVANISVEQQQSDAVGGGGQYDFDHHDLHLSGDANANANTNTITNTSKQPQLGTSVESEVPESDHTNSNGNTNEMQRSEGGKALPLEHEIEEKLVREEVGAGVEMEMESGPILGQHIVNNDNDDNNNNDSSIHINDPITTVTNTNEGSDSTTTATVIQVPQMELHPINMPATLDQQQNVLHSHQQQQQIDTTITSDNNNNAASNNNNIISPQTANYFTDPAQVQPQAHTQTHPPRQLSYYAMPDVPHLRPYSALVSGKSEKVQYQPTAAATTTTTTTTFQTQNHIQRTSTNTNTNTTQHDDAATADVHQSTHFKRSLDDPSANISMNMNMNMNIHQSRSSTNNNNHHHNHSHSHSDNNSTTTTSIGPMGMGFQQNTKRLRIKDGESMEISTSAASASVSTAPQSPTTQQQHRQYPSPQHINWQLQRSTPTGIAQYVIVTTPASDPSGASTIETFSTNTNINTTATTMNGSGSASTSADYTHFAPPHAFPTPPRIPVTATNTNTNTSTLKVEEGSGTSTIIRESLSSSTPAAGGTATGAYSRKDKALGLLAQRLVAMYEERERNVNLGVHVNAHTHADASASASGSASGGYGYGYIQQHQSQSQSQSQSNEASEISPSTPSSSRPDVSEISKILNSSRDSNDMLSSPTAPTTPSAAATATVSVPLLSIDQTASHLLVERRRIYDIINILEALNVVTKKGKNVYWWHGLQVLETTFRDLQLNAVYCDEFRLDAEKNGMFQLKSNNSSSNGDGDGNSTKNRTETTQSYFTPLPMNRAASAEDPKTGKSSNGAPAKEIGLKPAAVGAGVPTKYAFGSLGQLTKKFLSLYLIGYDALSLGEATERLLGFSDTSKEDVDNTTNSTNAIGYGSTSTTHRKRETQVKGWKTKVRRLYDIANVLCSIGIIDKTSNPLSHKKCGNMLTSDGRAIHFHKNNQYFYWKFPKTPKQILIDHQSFVEAGAAVPEEDKVENGVNDVSPVLCGNVGENPIVNTELSNKDSTEQEEAKDTNIIPSSIYEL